LRSVGVGRGCARLGLLLAAGFLLPACGAFSAARRADVLEPLAPLATVAAGPSGAEAPHLTAGPTAAADSVEPTALTEPEAAADPGPALPRRAPQTANAPAPTAVAQAPPGARAENGEVEQYDPWEPFNEKMFNFNVKLDKYALKPVARGYKAVVPEQLQIMISNGLDNIRFVPRLVNSVLQAKWNGALREVTRFVLNSTLGFGGLFDVGKYAGIERSNEDFGQTLGLWGMSTGPYLVLPFLEPMTVRDGVGRGVDLFMDPLAYYVPFVPDRLAMKAEDTVNERALNYDLFQGVEETTLDLYSSVRHFYLNRRENQIRE
jgi:phospholipid-binding lipoprotein MlaA